MKREVGSTNVSVILRDLAPLLVAGHDWELAADAKTAIVNRLVAIPKPRVQDVVVDIVHRVWPGFRRA